MSQIPSPYVITVSQHSYAYTVLEQNFVFMILAASVFLHKSIKPSPKKYHLNSPHFVGLTSLITSG